MASEAFNKVSVIQREEQDRGQKRFLRGQRPCSGLCWQCPPQKLLAKASFTPSRLDAPFYLPQLSLNCLFLLLTILGKNSARRAL